MFDNPRKIIGRSIGIGFFILIALFGFNRFGRYLAGPQIETISLQNYTETDSHEIIINGTLRNTAEIKVNNKNIPISDSAAFQHTVVIPTGHSIIEVDVYDTFGNTKNYQYTIVNTNIPDTYPSTYQQATAFDTIDENIENIDQATITN